jgi:hypothetical protein
LNIDILDGTRGVERADIFFDSFFRLGFTDASRHLGTDPVWIHGGGAFKINIDLTDNLAICSWGFQCKLAMGAKDRHRHEGDGEQEFFRERDSGHRGVGMKSGTVAGL